MHSTPHSREQSGPNANSAEKPCFGPTTLGLFTLLGMITIPQ